MREITFNEENGQFQEKNHKLSFSFIIFIIIFISLIIIGYIYSNIVLMKLGYQSLDLEQKKEQLLVSKNHLEYSVETLSSLTRIEKIAYQDLGMQRPEKIEFIAMQPLPIETVAIASQPTQQGEGTKFLEAGSFLKEFANLQIFKNQ